jgi:nitrate reductase gamma subunit
MEVVAVQTIYYIVLVPMVYVAFAVFIIGSVVKLISIFREPRHPSTLAIHPQKQHQWLWTLHDTFLLPTIRRHKPLLWVFLMFFHISFFLLIIGHIELLKEFRIFQIIEHQVFLGRGFVGLILSVCLLYLLFRRFVSPYRELSVPEDYYLLILLFLTVIFGSEMDWARTWYGYGELSVDGYREYLLSLLAVQPNLPASVMFSGHSFMLVLHVFFANLFLIVFPFSKIMHSFLALPVIKLRRG